MQPQNQFSNLRTRINAANQAPVTAPRPAPAPRPGPAPQAAPRPMAPAPRPVAPSQAGALPRPQGNPRAALPQRAPVQAAPARSQFGAPVRPTRQARPAGSPFAGVEGARTSFDANYMRTGHYLAKCDKVKTDFTRGGELFFAVEATVLVVFDDDNMQGHRVGEQVSFFQGTNGVQGDYFLPTVKKFVSTMFECEPSQIDQADCDSVCGPEQPMAGWCFEWSGRKSGASDFTKINFKRRVRSDELSGILDPRTLQSFFPGDALARMAESEAIEAQARGQIAPEALLAADFDAPQPANEEGPGVELYDDGNGGLCLADGTPCDQAGNPLEG